MMRHLLFSRFRLPVKISGFSVVLHPPESFQVPLNTDVLFGMLYGRPTYSPNGVPVLKVQHFLNEQNYRKQFYFFVCKCYNFSKLVCSKTLPNQAIRLFTLLSVVCKKILNRLALGVVFLKSLW